MIPRVDGLYRHVGEDTFSWLRFFEDGTVFGVSTTTDTEPSDLCRWFLKGKEVNFSSGRVLQDGAEIRFCLASEEGKVDYWGTLGHDSVELSSHSHINGRRTRSPERYDFVAVAAWPDGEASFDSSVTRRRSSDELADRLDRGEVDRGHVELAASLGDPLARLALMPRVRLDDVAIAFGSADARVCVRLLLALLWWDNTTFSAEQDSLSPALPDYETTHFLRAAARFAQGTGEQSAVQAAAEACDGLEREATAHLMAVVRAEDRAARERGLRRFFESFVRQETEAVSRMRNGLAPWLLGEKDPLDEKLDYEPTDEDYAAWTDDD